MEEAGNGADSDALVFVYGSLKRGMDNHRQLQGARWVGTGAMADLTLHDLGPFPMAVAAGPTLQPLRGELYRVNSALLQMLDRFEGVPRLYRREQRPLCDGELAWVYLGSSRQVRHAPLIASGCWSGPQPRFRRAKQPPANAQPPPAAEPGARH